MKGEVLTFGLACDLVCPPGLIKLSRECEENPSRPNKHEQESGKQERLDGSPIPVSIIHHALLELRKERLELLFRHGHRGRSLNVAVKGKALGRGDHGLNGSRLPVLRCFDAIVPFHSLSSFSPSMS